ncbi:hypothetical protein QBC39DRAFT_381058 [Podospora conica]|nr:hypothetical protein QBC39DRAFT_381058 [Schizothecium conicum]
MERTVFNHLALPQRLPGAEDGNIDEVEATIADRLAAACRAMSAIDPTMPGPDGPTLTPSPARNCWNAIHRAIVASRSVNKGGRVNKTHLLVQLQSLAQATPNRPEALVLHIRRQNAAIVVYTDLEYQPSAEVIFEVFEASPRNEDVLAADSALQWDFPGSAVAIPIGVFSDHDFQESLATFLEQASIAPFKQFTAQAFKAGTDHHEDRDTPSPRMISSMLVALLEENGRRINTPLLRKRVRDDVCWNNAQKPWRRLPYWLVLRVFVSRYLALSLGSDQGRFEYKFLLCVVFAELINSSRAELELEHIHFLTAKLCRRLAKLDTDRMRLPKNMAYISCRVDSLFRHLSPGIDRVIQHSLGYVRSAWDNHKRALKKDINPLPKRAMDRDMHLPLLVSGDKLRSMQADWRKLTTSYRHGWIAPRAFDPSSATSEAFANFAYPLLKLADMEASFASAKDIHDPSSLSHGIKTYLKRALPLYHGNVVQMSLCILTAMEQWVLLDQETCAEFPLLRDYHPVFTPEILDRLHLASYDDMVRLDKIQRYLARRIPSSEGPPKETIFDNPSESCFARRFYDEFPTDAQYLHSLHALVESAAERAKAQKHSEWLEKKSEYDSLARQVNGSTCTYIIEGYGHHRREVHDERQCDRCRATYRMSSMKIRVYEHPLPEDEWLAKVVIFELACPPAFQMYRDTTWAILSLLANGSFLRDQGSPPTCVVREYSELMEFASDEEPIVTLGSTTKSFLRTHYSIARFPVEWEGGRDGLCKPNGLRFSYYDSGGGVWIGRKTIRPTFAHHLGLQMPKGSLFQLSESYEGLSSYEIMASQPNCPSGINPHEFMAFKTLLSGVERRWISILVELASSNLNWSGETTMCLLNHLALQCGPQSETRDPLRVVHSVFRDSAFATKLLQQVERRLSDLDAAGNWREGHLMSILVTLAWRVAQFATPAGLPTEIRRKAIDHLTKARMICIGWFRTLREQIQTCSDPATSKQLQQRALVAALLCRQTFVVHLAQSAPLDASHLEVYIESTIAIQETLGHEIKALAPTMRQNLVYAIKLGHQLRDLVTRSILSHPQGFRAGLERFWPGASRLGGSDDNNLCLERDDWISCEMPESDSELQQTMHYSIRFGTLLVNGKPVGNLPQSCQNSVMMKELFGDQQLRVFQSSLPGMTYTLTFQPCNFTVHIGYEGNEMVIIAVARGLQLRLLPRSIFHDSDTWDLPIPLIENGFHWLNLGTGQVHSTLKRSNPFPINRNNWILNIQTGRCRRTFQNRETEDIIYPHAPLFQEISNILTGLAPPQKLLITQHQRKHVAVQIPSLQLMFFVDNNQRLFSPQLGLEVDPNQDAGTWYGLTTKLVCRAKDNPLRRTILVPIGNLRCKRWRGHNIVSFAKEGGNYGRFDINDTLGRIDCAPEPLLIYTRALIHAFTSFLLPDPLTGRTGAEEALLLLSSGICKPWTRLGAGHADLLRDIAELTPARVYYPHQLKSMKSERWNDDLNSHVQHPLYADLIEEILETSRQKAAFHPEQSDVVERSVAEFPPWGEQSLQRRAQIRRQLHERPLAGLYISDVKEHVYLPRDRPSLEDPCYCRVMKMTNILRTQPSDIEKPPDLAQKFAQVNTVGGYGVPYDAVAISERMKTDILESWGSLVEYCRGATSSYSLMFLISALAFRDTVDESLLRVLVAFSAIPALKTLPLPTPWVAYVNFRPNTTPHLDDLVRLAMPHRIVQTSGPGDGLDEFLSSKERRRRQATADALDLRSEDDCRYLARYLLQQWPCFEPTTGALLRKDLLVDPEAALETIRPEWRRLYRNYELSQHLQQVQAIMHLSTGDTVWRLPPSHSPPHGGATIFPCRARGGEIPQLEDLMSQSFGSNPHHNHEGASTGWLPLTSNQNIRAPRIPPNASSQNSKPQISQNEASGYIRELGEIVQELSETKSLVRTAYASALVKSLEAFKNKRTPQQLGKTFYFLRDVSKSRNEVVRLFLALRASVEAPTATLSAKRIAWLQQSGLWPAITTVSLLAHLRSKDTSATFGVGMKAALTSFGLAITKFQRDRRLNAAVVTGDPTRFDSEEANVGHQNWNPEQHGDWLLLEIESNLLIRPDQVDVARATIWPESGANSVLQMNMGLGKTSCIIPMVAAAMADGKNLARVIVPKALLLQTAQLLQSRLGGLLNRAICHVPFSRRTPTTQADIRQYASIHKQVLKHSGVMICLPEHNLSFMLSGQQRLLDGHLAEAKPMIRMQSWLKTVCRDILDESDYTLSARTQLIYPSGSQISLDGSPSRWLCIQTVLSLVDRHLYGLRSSFPHSIDVFRNHDGGFPIIYFLRQDVEDELLRRVAVDITQGLGNVLPMRALGAWERIAIKDFLTPGNHKLRAATLDAIRRLCPEKPHVRETVYLLRGLIVNRILLMTLKKRWNVQYGLHPLRDPIAVPYHAKGVPSDNSEFGHADVSILFTCLAFYHEGVNEARLRQALTRVLKSDDPSTEYEKWIQSTDKFPESLRAWNTINVEDEMQMHEVWKAVRYSVVVINYFLNNFVFPRHAKQFKVKLQSSGWDIPIHSASQDASAGLKTRSKQLTTGFSGTNDNRTLLPLTITQSDLPTLSHTNAEVLSYLLHKRSRRCEIVRDVRGGRATERDLLFMLKKRGIRILIDAGAHILEMDNETLAQTWLTIDSQMDAALYFDKDNKPWIISSKGRKTPLLASPFADDLSRCLVYLDEAHTRGTDLHFPLDARGALTVSQGQTKDSTVQAAMRLRQLGSTQAVTFFVPPEVHQEVIDLRGKSTTSEIDSKDIISWLLSNTCDGIEALQPLYISQGNDFCRRTQAALENPKYLSDSSQCERYKRAIKQNEMQTLQDMYEPKAKCDKAATVKSSHPDIAGFVKELIRLRKGFQDTGRAVHASALQEVEQEREVEFEVEAVRRVKKSIKYDAFGFPGLHRDIEMLARHARLPADSHSLSHVLRVLARTAIGSKHGVLVSGGKSKLFVSAEWLRTVKYCMESLRDSFLRPVSWVLWNEAKQEAVVLIPEEAECVMQMMRAKSTHPQIFLISYASPVTKRMLVFNDLRFYSMPSLPANWQAPTWLKMELGILAGRLYFEWDEYRELCDFLAIGAGDEAMLYEEDGIVGEGGAALDASPAVVQVKEQQQQQPTAASFSKRPLTFLQDWLAVRRHGQDFAHTPMGFLTQSKPLHESHPFFCADGLRPDVASVPAGVPARRARPVIVESDEEDHLDGVDDMGANVESDGEDTEGGSSRDDEDTGEDERAGEHGSDSDARTWFSMPEDSDSS